MHRTRLLRIVAVFVLALSGVVGAFATISPAPDAVFLGGDMVREPYPIDLETALLPTPELRLWLGAAKPCRKSIRPSDVWLPKTSRC